MAWVALLLDRMLEEVAVGAWPVARAGTLSQQAGTVCKLQLLRSRWLRCTGRYCPEPLVPQGVLQPLRQSRRWRSLTGKHFNLTVGSCDRAYIRSQPAGLHFSRWPLSPCLHIAYCCIKGMASFSSCDRPGAVRCSWHRCRNSEAYGPAALLKSWSRLLGWTGGRSLFCAAGH